MACTLQMAGLSVARTFRYCSRESRIGLGFLPLGIMEETVFGFLFRNRWGMRYLVTARVKPGKEQELLQAIEDGKLGAGSVAGSEYLRNMQEARFCEAGKVKWVEVCFCGIPLAEERPYWEAYFHLVRVQDAHNRKHCRDLNGTEPWACGDCDCSARLETKLASQGETFLDSLRAAVRNLAASPETEKTNVS